MELRVLKYFVTVAEEQSITHAAQRLHLTQPTLSRQLAALEDELGVQLFRRSGRKMLLTSQGLLLRRRAEELLELAEVTENEIRQKEEAVEGTIRFCSGDLHSFALFCPVIESFAREYPGVRFELFSGSAQECREKMEHGLMDIGIFLEPAGLDDYIYLRFKGKDRWRAMMSASHPLASHTAVTKEDLLPYPLDLPMRAVIRNELAHWFGPDASVIQARFTSNLPPLAALLVENSQVINLGMAGSTDLFDPSRIVSIPLDPPLYSSTLLAWKRQSSYSPAFERFLEYLPQFSFLFEEDGENHV